MDKKLMASMRAESESWCPKETGGVLMGYWSHQDVVITDIVGSGPKAVHRRFSFTPDAKWQEKEVARIYEESGRIITYLGDWHSHPFGTSRLSFKDLVTLFRVAVHKPARAPRPIMGIMHNNPLWKLEIWNFKFSETFSCVPASTMEVVWFDGSARDHYEVFTLPPYRSPQTTTKHLSDEQLAVESRQEQAEWIS